MKPDLYQTLGVARDAKVDEVRRAYRKAVNYSIVVTLVCVMQIALLFRQLYFSRTQVRGLRGRNTLPRRLISIPTHSVIIGTSVSSRKPSVGLQCPKLCAKANRHP